MTKRKTTPHLRPGPKPKPKPPKRAKGRPEVSLREHPDRYVVARFDLADTWPKEIVAGGRLSAALVRGVDTVHRSRDVDDLRMAADRLRVMARRYRKPDDMEWRKAIGTSVAFALLTAADPIANPNELAIICGVIVDEAASVGEEEWARREVLPLIGLRPSVPVAEHDLRLQLAGLVASIGWASDIRRWMAVRDAREAPPVIEGIFPPA